MNMTKIVLAGDVSDSRLTLSLCRCLSKRGGVLYIGNKTVTQYGDAPAEYLVYEPYSAETYSADRTVFVLSSPPPAGVRVSPPFCDTAVIAGDCDGICDGRAALSPNLILCGMSEKSSISLSSADGCKAVISVKRSITLLSGKTLEPCEFTVLTDGKIDSYTLLYICAVLILCEKFSASELTLFG